MEGREESICTVIKVEGWLNYFMIVVLTKLQSQKCLVDGICLLTMCSKGCIPKQVQYYKELYMCPGQSVDDY